MIVAIFGFVSFLRVPVQMSPDLTQTSITVMTMWPGATPQDVEREIVREQERFLRSIPNLEKLTSSSSTGFAQVVLDFRLGTPFEEILVQTQNALSQVPSYPENVDQPRILTTSGSDQPIAWFSLGKRKDAPEDLNVTGMQRFAEDNIKTALERTPGVSQSEVLGGARDTVNIYVDPAKLAERDITIGELRQAIRSRNRDTSGGDFNEGKRRYLIRTVGRFDSLQAVEDTIIAHRDGNPVFLRDVGHAESGLEQFRAVVRASGEPGIGINVRRRAGTNILEVMDAVKATVAELNEGILQENGLRLEQVTDDTVYIRDAVRLVIQNLLVGGFFASMVLLLFLRSFPATIIGALAIPICIVSSFLGLTLTGRTVNVISLAGIAFAIGMTVDASIVVLENIDRHMHMGKKMFNAALDGTRQVWGAILASTLTTVIVFLPIVFVQEEAGQLFADIGIAISSAIILALFTAITVIPTACYRFMRYAHEQPTTWMGRRMKDLFGLVWLASQFKEAVLFFVKWLMAGVLRRVVLVLALTGVSLGTAFYLAPQTDYLPDGNRNILFAFMIPPPGYNLDEMSEIGRQLEDQFVPHIGADPALFHKGEADVPALDYFLFVATTSFQISLAVATDPNDSDDLKQVLNNRLNQVPGMIAFTTRPSIFPTEDGGSRAIQVDITGRDLEEIYRVAGMAFGQIMQSGISESVRPDPGLVLGQPLVEIRPDFVRAAELGVSSQDLGYTIWSMTDGAYLDEFYQLDDRVDMFLYSTEGTIRNLDDLQNLKLRTRGGGVVPLSSVASLVETVDTETIRRVNNQRAVTLTVVPPRSLPLEVAADRLQNEIIGGMQERGMVPPGVSMQLSGATDKLADTRDALTFNLFIAIIVTYLLMVALFAHWGYPLVIMMSLPLGIVGGVLGLWIMNAAAPFLNTIGVGFEFQALDVLTMLGFVILVGTVVNNPILIVNRTLQLIREDGMPVLDAVLESVRIRIRPIMMSTLTTVGALSPLVLVPGAGAELYRGLGIVILFGLFCSTIFTLTFIPSLLSLSLQAGEVLRARTEELKERILPASDAPAAEAPNEPAYRSAEAPTQDERVDRRPDAPGDTSPSPTTS